MNIKATRTILIEPEPQHKQILTKYNDQILDYNTKSQNIILTLFHIIPHEMKQLVNNHKTPLTLFGLNGQITIKYGDQFVIRTTESGTTFTQIYNKPQRLNTTTYKHKHEPSYEVINIDRDNIDLFRQKIRQRIDDELNKIRTGDKVITPLLYDAELFIRKINDNELEASYEQSDY